MVVPENWDQYVIERTSEKSAFFQSGVITDVNAMVTIPEGGTTIHMPFFQDLDGADDVLDESDLSVNNVSTSQDEAVILRRAKVFGSNDLAADLAGDDPMRMIGDRFAEYWARRAQKTLIETLNGAFTALSENQSDISSLSGAASNFDGEAFIDATAKLGDHQDDLAAVAVHSATYTAMKKQDLIDFIPDSEGKPTIPAYMGKTVIVDDGLPVTSGVYTTYIFGPGSVAYAEGSPKVAAEMDREPLKNGGAEYMVNRRYWVLHPRGVRWTPGSGVPASTSGGPTNSELSGSNWSRVWEPENIKLVQFKHTLA
jgi:hypothetical protein